MIYIARQAHKGTCSPASSGGCTILHALLPEALATDMSGKKETRGHAIRPHSRSPRPISYHLDHNMLLLWGSHWDHVEAYQACQYPQVAGIPYTWEWQPKATPK